MKLTPKVTYPKLHRRGYTPPYLLPKFLLSTVGHQRRTAARVLAHSENVSCENTILLCRHTSVFLMSQHPGSRIPDFSFDMLSRVIEGHKVHQLSGRVIEASHRDSINPHSVPVATLLRKHSLATELSLPCCEYIKNIVTFRLGGDPNTSSLLGFKGVKRTLGEHYRKFIRVDNDSHTLIVYFKSVSITETCIPIPYLSPKMDVGVIEWNSEQLRRQSQMRVFLKTTRR